jgi:hypothetical protein
VRRARDEPTTFVASPPPAPAPERVERTEAVAAVVPDADVEATAAVAMPEATEAMAVPSSEPAASEPAASGSDPDATLFLAVPQPDSDSDETLVLEVPVRVMGKLVVVKGELQGEEYELREGENKLGRGPDSDVVLASMWISRTHAVIRCMDGRIEVASLSDKITSVNGQPVSDPLELEAGDTLQLGGTVFRLETES